jgi:Delta3,5-Delta2,4-dienoyl-CoA isomerase
LTVRVICILHGAAIGIAIDISSACDIRVASRDTKLSIKEVDIGLAADLGTLQRFPRLVGNDSWTRELALSGRFFSASEALERGFVSYVLESQGKALEKGMDIAKTIVLKSPVAVQGTKILLDYSRDHTVREGITRLHYSNDRFGIHTVMEFNLFADFSIICPLYN